LQGTLYIYDISRLRVKQEISDYSHVNDRRGMSSFGATEREREKERKRERKRALLDGHNCKETKMPAEEVAVRNIKKEENL
jgi:hypothetical protein